MQQITVQEFKKRIDAGEQLNILDVREQHEYDEFNIGGKLLPLGRIQSMQVGEIEDWKEQEIIIYCRSGARSQTAGMYLETMGFTNTKNLDGGMIAWQEQERAVK